MDESRRSAAADALQKQRDLDKLIVHAKQHQLELDGNVPYDGNCLFHSVQKVNGGPSHVQLRADLVQYLKGRVSIFQCTHFTNKNFISNTYIHYSRTVLII